MQVKDRWRTLHMDHTKRIIPAQPGVIIVPSAENLLTEALGLIQTEILQFRHKVNGGKPLQLNEARVLQGYIKSLVELSKEARERAKSEDLSKMSTEELIDLLQTLISAQKSKK